MISPMLLSEYDSCEERIFQEHDIFIQPKLDGWRCVVDTKTGTLYSRSGNKINLPHISADVIGRDLPEFIDGELYCHGFTLGQIQSMIRKGDTRIKLHIFDVVSDATYEDRAEIVAGIAETENIKRVETHRISPADVDLYYHRFLDAGYEGAVIRLAWARYEQRRVRTVIKLKPVYN
jgi:ATP-dependent DNA ligase